MQDKEDIFDAARGGNVDAVKKLISSGIDLSEVNAYGFNPLHCAAMGTNSGNINHLIEIMNTLLAAGASIEALSKDKRTPLYLAAEFSPKIEPIKFLVEMGANPDVYDSVNNHILKNAMMQETKEFLSEITGKPIPEKAIEPKTRKLKPGEWKAIKLRLESVFSELTGKGIISLAGAGYTQEEGFSDCAAKANEIKPNITLLGFCYFTIQDTKRAKATGILPLAFWGAPDGKDGDTESVGKTIVETVTQRGFKVDWNEKADIRPIIRL